MDRTRFNVRVYGILINDHQEVLLSDEEEKGSQFVKFPGGGLEYGEGLIEGLKREFLEECNLPIEILSHFYTTDFFVESVFGGGQLLSIYYLVKPLQALNFKIGKHEYDFEGQTGLSKQCFRFVHLKSLEKDLVTYTVDQHVVGLLKDQYL